MNIAFILAVGFFLSILTFIAFNLDKEHIFLKLFLIFLILFSFPIMIKGLIQDCSYVLSSQKETYIYGNNFTYANGSATYHWDYSASGIPPTADKGVFVFHKNTSNKYTYQCIDISHNKEIEIYLKVTNWLIRVFAIYLLIYISYISFKKISDKNGIKN